MLLWQYRPDLQRPCQLRVVSLLFERPTNVLQCPETSNELADHAKSAFSELFRGQTREDQKLGFATPSCAKTRSTTSRRKRSAVGGEVEGMAGGSGPAAVGTRGAGALDPIGTSSHPGGFGTLWNGLGRVLAPHGQPTALEDRSRCSRRPSPQTAVGRAPGDGRAVVVSRRCRLLNSIGVDRG